MAFFKYRVRSLAELREREAISEPEEKQLETAYDFLLWVRNQLHYQVNRAGDVLSRSLQPTLAFGLGYTDRSPRKRLERFMRDVYQHMRNVYFITRTAERRLALSSESKSICLWGRCCARGADARCSGSWMDSCLWMGRFTPLRGCLSR